MEAHERRRVLLMLGVILAIAMAPGLILTVLGLADGATVSVFAALTALLANLMAGLRPALLVLAGLAVTSALAIAFDANPWALALISAAYAAGVAMSAERGHQGALILGPVSLAFLVSEPPMTQFESPVRVLLVLGVTLGAGLLALLVAHLLIPVHLPPGESVSRSRATTYAVMLAILVGIATWFVVDRDLGHAGAWIVMTILLVVQPYVQDGWHLAIHRALGTILGFLIAVCFGVMSGLPVIIYIAGGIFMYAAIVLKLEKRPYWQYAAMLTPAVILLEGASGSLTQAAWQRLWATLIGAAAALAMILIVAPLYRRDATKNDLERW